MTTATRKQGRAMRDTEPTFEGLLDDFEDAVFVYATEQGANRGDPNGEQYSRLQAARGSLIAHWCARYRGEASEREEPTKLQVLCLVVLVLAVVVAPTYGLLWLADRHLLDITGGLWYTMGVASGTLAMGEALKAAVRRWAP